MTDFASHSDVGTSLGNNLTLVFPAVEPRIGDPLICLDDEQGEKYDDHRVEVDHISEVCSSILTTVIEPMILPHLIFPEYLIDLVDFRRYQKLKKWVDHFRWRDDGTFEIRTNVPFFYKDLLEIGDSKTLYPLDFNELPPIQWIWQPKRKYRYRFYVVDFEGQLLEVRRSDLSPFEDFKTSSLRWVDFKKRQENLDDCSGQLIFSEIVSAQGKKRYRLADAEFCRQRLCPMCMWRRSLVWYSRFLERFSTIVSAFKNYRLLHLVLTVPNVHISELRQTIQRMNKAWQRMIDLKVKNPIFPEYKVVKGFLRSVEVTREYDWRSKIVLDEKTAKPKEVKYAIGMGREGFVHPHFHILLAVPSTYMYHGKIPAARWLEIWKQAMQDDSITNVKINLVQGGKKFMDMELGSLEDIKKAILNKNSLFGSLPELVKYSTKPSDFSKPFQKGWETAEQRDFFYYKYEREVKFLRFISTGGIFKDILGKDKDVDNVSNEEMINEGVGSYLKEGERETNTFYNSSWDKELRHYYVTSIEGDCEE